MTMTPEQIEAHMAVCDGCSICHGEPPTPPPLEQAMETIAVNTMFRPLGSTEPSVYERTKQSFDLIGKHLGKMTAQRQQAASKPRKGLSKRLIYLELAVIASDRYRAAMPATARGWRNDLAKRCGVQWRTLATALPDLGLTVKDLEQYLTDWRPPKQSATPR